MTPGAGRVRASVERRSATVVVWLAHKPRLLAPLVIAVLFIGGAASHGVVAMVLLLVVAAIMGLVSYLSWPSVPPRLRGIRLVVLLGVVAFAVAKVA